MFCDRRGFYAAFIIGIVALSVSAQISDICRETGEMPSLDPPRARIPYIYGRVSVIGADPSKPPKVTVIFWDREQSESRWNVGKSGNYCFKRNNASGGMLVVEVDGTEVARKSLPSMAPDQQREDFEVTVDGSKSASIGTVSAKFVRPPNDKTTVLYKRAVDAERGQEPAELINVLKEIVTIDPADFIAWAKLGTVHFEQGNLSDANSSLRRSLELRIDYTPAWINIGKLRMAQNQFEAAAEILKHAANLEPKNARILKLLGEAYIYAKKGTLGAEALNRAIELDPVSMADSHLLLATLYDRAGAKHLASREYRLFLQKVKEHPDKNKFKKYIQEHPER